MKNIVLIAILFSFSLIASSQLSDQARQDLQKHEDTLASLINQAIHDSVPQKRIAANYEFIPRLVDVLKTKNSFFYPFSALEPISILYPQDSTFRIFSWMVKGPGGSYRFFGAIQEKSPQLKLHPLIDYSDSLYKPIDSVLDTRHWYGAYYYNIRHFQSDGKDHYLLFGYDPNNPFSTLKVLDVLHFSEQNKPLFGAPVFYYQTEKEQDPHNHHRFFIEYKKQANATMNYNPRRDVIVYDHLVPPDRKSRGSKFLYIPDGTYEGFQLKDGKWKHVDKIFHYSIGDPDNPPVPHPKKGGSSDTIPSRGRR